MLPSMSEYREALQHPQIAFKEPDLKQGVVEQTPLGLPKLVSGGFALTACVTTQTGGRQSKWAIRCFHKQAADLQDRYSRISNFLRDKNEEFFVNFNYEPEGIRVGSNWHPIVRMAWVEGKPFHEFIEASLSNPSNIQNLAEQVKLMSKRLRELGMAHGDLQHGNILVRDGKLVLIDYDGMYVPEMPYQTSNETGLSAFQHPRRDQSFFNETIDRFSSIAIYISLLCVASPKGSELWRQYHTGENLLFTQQDYRDPGNSTLFTEIQRHLENKPNHELKRLVNKFQQICLANLEAVPSLDQLLNERFSISLPNLPPAPPAPQQGQFKTFWAHDIQLVKQEGERITVIGRVDKVAVYGESSNSIAVFIKFEAFKGDSTAYQPFKLVVFSEGLNSLSSTKRISTNNLKQFEGKYLKVTGLLELIEIDKSNVAPHIIIENARQLIEVTEREANRVSSSPFRHDPQPYLCSNCTYHLDDTCPIPERPYVKSCDRYWDSSKQTALQLPVSREMFRNPKRFLEQSFGGLTQKNFWVKQWNRAVRLIPQRIQLNLQTAFNPGRPLYLKVISGAGVIGVAWGVIFFSVRDTTPPEPKLVFNDHISEYYTITGLMNPTKINRSLTKPYIKGRIIPVAIDKVHGSWGSWIDDIYYQIPEDLRATKPKDVGTVVWLEWAEDATTCKVTIIDKTLPIIVKEINFKRGTSISTKKIKIVNYLKSLPRK
jgi:RIO1 family